MVALVVYYIRSPEWGRFLCVSMGMVFFEDANIPVEPAPFDCEQCAQEVIDSWKLNNGCCFVEEGLL